MSRAVKLPKAGFGRLGIVSRKTKRQKVASEANIVSQRRPPRRPEKGVYIRDDYFNH